MMVAVFDRNERKMFVNFAYIHTKRTRYVNTVVYVMCLYLDIIALFCNTIKFNCFLHYHICLKYYTVLNLN